MPLKQSEMTLVCLSAQEILVYLNIYSKTFKIKHVKDENYLVSSVYKNHLDKAHLSIVLSAEII